MAFISVARAAESPLVVLYPDTPRSVSAVFAGILSGINDAATPEVDVVTYPVDGTTSATRLDTFLQRTKPKAIITLGSTPYQLYESVRGELPPPIVGALDVTPETHPNTRGIGLGVDPDILFKRLKLVSANTTRVLAVYNPARDASNMEQALIAAKRHGIRLRLFEAKNLSESTMHYRNILRYGNPVADALWLTLDTNLLDNTATLPRVIEDSWTSKTIVFSNNLAHAHKGVLFAMYPDPIALGRQLFSMSQEPGGSNPQIQPLRDARSALNERISDHLNLSLPASVRRNFDLILEGR